VKLHEAEQMKMEEILDLPIRNVEGIPVMIRNVVTLLPRTGPVAIERKNQERILYIYAQIRDRDMGSVISDIRERITLLPLPEGFSVLFGGDYAEQRRAFRELALSVILALILVYMVMASLYESLRYPLVVMFSVPFATIGIILMLFLTGTTFNIQSGIGALMLGGIVVNNAIILVDHINLLRNRDGMDLKRAIAEAGSRRLRPILMTTITTVSALTPLAFGLGEGGEAQAPLARAVIGGLLSSSLITLVLIPTIYYLFEKKREERVHVG
jgi:HAE1 family hydrophobic/amphiphilic exporter-1